MNLKIKLYCLLIVFFTTMSSKAFSQEFAVDAPSEQTRIELEQMYSMPDATGEYASPSLRSGPPVGPPIGGIPTGELPVAILAVMSGLYIAFKRSGISARKQINH